MSGKQVSEQGAAIWASEHSQSVQCPMFLLQNPMCKTRLLCKPTAATIRATALCLPQPCVHAMQAATAAAATTGRGPDTPQGLYSEPQGGKPAAGLNPRRAPSHAQLIALPCSTDVHCHAGDRSRHHDSRGLSHLTRAVRPVAWATEQELQGRVEETPQAMPHG